MPKFLNNGFKCFCEMFCMLFFSCILRQHERFQNLLGRQLVKTKAILRTCEVLSEPLLLSAQAEARKLEMVGQKRPSRSKKLWKQVQAPMVIKHFCMLSSTEHEISIAHDNQNAENDKVSCFRILTC